MKWRWNPVDWIVAGLTTTIVGALLMGAVFRFLIGEPLSEQSREMYTGVLTSMIAVISVYVGAAMRRGGKDEDDDTK